MILTNGWFTECRLSTPYTVMHCRKALKAVGYDPINDLIIGYVPSDKKSKPLKSDKQG